MEELLIKAQEGDTDALDRLLDWAREYSYRIAFYVLFDREEAEEVAQECTWRFFKNIEDMSPLGSLKGWIRRVSVNLSIDRIRKHSRLVPLEGQALSSLPSNKSIIPVERCLGCLTSIQRTVITLFYIENTPIQEIAEVLGISSGTVKTHLFRARKKLKECFMREGLL